MTSSFTPDIIGHINNHLKTANTLFSENYPGESPERQPVHTVYGGAHIFKEGTAMKMGDKLKMLSPVNFNRQRN